MKASNQLIGVVNFLTFLASIPILIGGIWLSGRANSTDCLKFLQWPVVAIGGAVAVISLAGIAGACYRNTLLMRVYLWAMFFVIAALVGFVIFAYAVTSKDTGRRVPNRVYEDYYLQDSAGWLRERVEDSGYWAKISSCIRSSRVCARTHRVFGGAPESAEMFYLRRLTPVESGCCKPPTECGYAYQSETTWMPGTGGGVGNPDCGRWRNEQEELCYACDSCKAGVLASLKKSWRKVSLINVVVLALLVLFYLVAVAAFRNDKRMENDEPYGQARMTKSHPGAAHF